MPDREHPFYCGSQGADWRFANCENCKKSEHYRDGKNQRDFVWLCDIERAIDEAYVGDGSVSGEIAARMGFAHDAFCWHCPEQDPVYDPAGYFAHHAPSEKVLQPLWCRLKSALEFTLELWNRPWHPEVDIYGVMGRIDLLLAWHVAWGIHHDDKMIKPGWVRPPLPQPLP